MRTDDDFADWVGRQEKAQDVLDPLRSNALRAALGEVAPLAEGDALPPLHHWLYFWDVRPPEGLGADGHPARGGFLPPVTLPRRMWAGGRLQFPQPLRLGEAVTRVSTIRKVEAKSGRGGKLVFVTVRHELSGANGLALIEDQDIVYREAASPDATAARDGRAQAPDAPWRRDIFPDAVLLFRYSALTMNGHRIHYDRRFATREASYPGLVVHGPLQATLLADLATAHLQRPLGAFAFRGVSPAFDGQILRVFGAPADGLANLWTEQGGSTCMTATAS